MADARHLAAASGVSIDIDAARVPCIAGVDASVALHGGEEYELLVTSSSALDAEAFSLRFGLPLSEIGRVGSGDRSDAVHVDGAHVASGQGYDHFSR